MQSIANILPVVTRIAGAAELNPSELREINNLIRIRLPKSDIRLRQRRIRTGGDEIACSLRAENKTIRADPCREARMGSVGNVGVAPDGQHD